jgi:hypothetical protein
MPDSVTTLELVVFAALLTIALAVIAWLFALFLRTERERPRDQRSRTLPAPAERKASGSRNACS